MSEKKTFSKDPDQFLGLSLRDFHICATSHRLTNQYRSYLIFNFLRSGSGMFYLKNIDPQQSFQTVFDKLRIRYDTLYNKMSPQSEIDSLSFDSFESCYQIRDETEGPQRISLNQQQHHPTVSRRTLR